MSTDSNLMGNNIFMQEKRRKKLGEILIAQGLITQEQLVYALQEHKRTGISIGTVLVKLGYISDDDLSNVLGAQIQLDRKKDRRGPCRSGSH